MRLAQFVERRSYEVLQGRDRREVTTLVNDSRKVEQGSVFVCICGAVADGHRFAADVAEKGAAALVVQREVEVPGNVTVIRVEDTRYALALMSAAYFGYPAEKMKIVGITGTKGKTTTIRNPMISTDISRRWLRRAVTQLLWKCPLRG